MPTLVVTQAQVDAHIQRNPNDRKIEKFTGAPRTPNFTSIEDGLFFRFLDPDKHQVLEKEIQGQWYQYCVVQTYDPATQEMDIRDFFPTSTGKIAMVIQDDGSKKKHTAGGDAAKMLYNAPNYNVGIDNCRDHCKKNDVWIKVSLTTHQKCATKFGENGVGPVTLGQFTFEKLPS